MFSWLRSFFPSPFFVSVEPAAVCQLHCPACPVGINHKSQITNHKSQLMPRDIWERVLSQIKDSARIIQFYFQGEPLLHKDLPVMIREAHQAGLYTIVSTNAQAMTQDLANALVAAGLNRIIVSMDGLTEESYSAYRVGGSLEQCKKALQWLQKAKQKQSSLPPSMGGSRGATIELQVLRLKTNEHEWEAFKRLYRSLGADRLTFKTAQLYDYAAGHPLMPSNPRYSRYRLGSDGLYHRKNRWPWCTRVLTGCVIATNGDVLPCCYDKAHEYVYGNIMEAPLAEILRSDKARAFMRAAQKEQPAICKECWR